MVRIACILLLLSFSVTGQNWTPLNSIHTYNYFSSSGYTSASVIKTDSVKLSGPDSILFLNLILKDIPVSHKLKAQPQFLGSRIIKKPNGIVVSKGDHSYTLLTLAGPGTSWLSDTLNNYTAQIVSAKKDSVIGQTDSVKVVSFSNGDTLFLSQNFGITYFKKNNTPYYLKGIEDISLGYHVPNFADFFDFAPGDTFEYQKLLYRSTTSVFNTYMNTYHYKICIQTKNINGNTITYTGTELSSDTVWGGYQMPYNIVQNLLNDTLKYTDSSTHLLNGYRNMITSYGRPCYWTGGTSGYKQLYFNYNPQFNTNLKMTIDSSYATSVSDTLYPYYYSCNLYETFGAGFGSIYQYDYEYCGGCSNTYITRLLGAVKNGITYGKITPNWMFYAGMEKRSEKTMGIYPVPVSDQLFITGIRDDQYGYIYSNLGQLVLQKRLTSKDNSFDVSTLKEGAYFIRLINDLQEPTVLKFIKN